MSFDAWGDPDHSDSFEDPLDLLNTPNPDREAEDERGALARPLPAPRNGAAPQSATLRTLDEILTDLRKPIPKRLLETRTQAGKQITYCPWHHVVKMLDHYAGGHWDYEVTDRRMLPPYERVKDKKTGEMETKIPFSITVRMTLRGSDGSAYREGTGYEELPVGGYGDVQSNAESMALRRAAAKLGLGLHLYEKD